MPSGVKGQSPVSEWSASGRLLGLGRSSALRYRKTR